MERCPTCRAKLQGNEGQCPRCRSELGRLWVLEARSRRHLRCAVSACRHDKEQLAVWAVGESLRLKRDPLGIALGGFLRRRQERLALQCFIAGDEARAQKALTAAQSLNSRRFAAALRGFFAGRGRRVEQPLPPVWPY